jgi:hypothetical protein
MNRICWLLVDGFSRFLHWEEREAVQGDIAELGLTCDRALVEVLGLVVRRQALLWTE